MNIDNIKQTILGVVGAIVATLAVWGLVTPDEATEITDAAGIVVDTVASGADSATGVWTQVVAALTGLWAALTGLDLFKTQGNVE